jgi:type IV pilus assembly protein PilC
MKRSVIASSELAQFYQQLASLWRARVPLVECFDLLKQDTESARLAGAIADLRRWAQEGAALSTCLARSALNIGEAANRLLSDAQTPEDTHAALMALADEQEHLALVGSIKRKLFFWPMVYLSFAGFFMVVLSVFVLPAFQSVYDGFDVAPPLPTQIMLSMGPYTLLSVVGLALFWYVLYRSKWPFALATTDNALDRIPVLGTMRKRIAVHQYIRMLSMLLLRKIPMESALVLAANSVDSEGIAEAFRQAKINEGHGLLEHLRAMDLVPKRFIKLIDIAERTQTMDEALRGAADSYGNAMIDDMLRYQDKIELLFKLVIGVFFALIAAAVYLPIFHMGALS